MNYLKNSNHIINSVIVMMIEHLFSKTLKTVLK